MAKDARDTQGMKTTGLNRQFSAKPAWVNAALLLGLVMGAGALQAKDRILDLETKIWTTNLTDFPKLERSAVRELQNNPGAYEHYLIAELSLRMFKQNPAELRYLKQASDMSQQAIELAPNQEFGYLVAAQVLELMGYKQDANEMLSDRPTFKQSWRSSFVRGVIASSHASDQESLKEFATSLKDPGVPKELLATYVASELEANHSGSDLVSLLEQWRKQVDAPSLQLSLARAFEEAGQYEKAHALYTSLDKANPSDELKFADAVILYSKLNQTKHAEKLLHEIVARAGNDAEIGNSAKAHLGKIALVKGQTGDAGNLFLEALGNTQDRLKWIAFTHKSYTESKKLQDFALLLDELRQKLPGTSYLYALQGEVLSESLAQHEKAVESFAAAITLEPGRSEFYNGMGLAFYRMHKNEQALSTFNQALKIDPRDATARYNEACVLAIMGRNDEAVGSLKQAISLDGRLQDIAMKDKDFAGIRQNAQFQSLVDSSKLTTAP